MPSMQSPQHPEKLYAITIRTHKYKVRISAKTLEMLQDLTPIFKSLRDMDTINEKKSIQPVNTSSFNQPSNLNTNIIDTDTTMDDTSNDTSEKVDRLHTIDTKNTDTCDTFENAINDEDKMIDTPTTPRSTPDLPPATTTHYSDLDTFNLSKSSNTFGNVNDAINNSNIPQPSNPTDIGLLSRTSTHLGDNYPMSDTSSTPPTPTNNIPSLPSNVFTIPAQYEISYDFWGNPVKPIENLSDAIEPRAVEELINKTVHELIEKQTKGLEDILNNMTQEVANAEELQQQQVNFLQNFPSISSNSSTKKSRFKAKTSRKKR